MTLTTNDDLQLDACSLSPMVTHHNDDADSIRAQVWTVLGALYPRGGQLEHRGEQRFPYPYLVHLTPVSDDGMQQIGDPIVVVGKHLSEGGLGFYHPKPLPYRHMVATLNSPDGSVRRFMIDLTWCRFTEQGWYESGGKFVEAMTDEPKPAALNEQSDQQSGEELM